MSCLCVCYYLSGGGGDGASGPVVAGSADGRPLASLADFAHSSLVAIRRLTVMPTHHVAIQSLIIHFDGTMQQLRFTPLVPNDERKSNTSLNKLCSSNLL